MLIPELADDVTSLPRSIASSNSTSGLSVAIGWSDFYLPLHTDVVIALLGVAVSVVAWAVGAAMASSSGAVPLSLMVAKTGTNAG